MSQSFSAEATLRRLKDFQRRTVDYVFRRLYLDSDPAKRFLVADEGPRHARLALACAVRTVLRNGLALLGVSAPESM